MRNAAQEPRGENGNEGGETKGGARNKERVRGRDACFAVQSGRRERGFLSLAVKEITRDVIVPLRSPTWSTLRCSHGYGNALAGGYGTWSESCLEMGVFEGR